MTEDPPVEPCDPSYYPTYLKYSCLFTAVSNLSVRDKRKIFSLMRSGACDHNTFMLAHGMSLGEFCSMHILNEHARK